jgi:outer membrane protein OmpA-like peptidoglycan-associated protein
MSSTPNVLPMGILVMIQLALAACGGGLGSRPPIASLRGPPAPTRPNPTPKGARVTVRQDRIEIAENIRFDPGQATIQPESHSLLDDIIAVLQANPRLKKISIEGHTDAGGTEAHNQKLSEERAHAVQAYFVEHGVSEKRLISRGHGESQPIADNSTAEGREKNRRVEFLVEEQEPVTRVYEVDPTTGERREVFPSRLPDPSLQEHSD